jgi:heme/copper-type cytochrome/quinol oxidase subunit 3
VSRAGGAEVVRDLSSWRQPRSEGEVTARVGMLVFLAAWTMLFAGLFFAYGLLRGRAESWPPPDLPPLPRLVPGLATLVLAASEGGVRRAIQAGWPRPRRSSARWLGLAALLGAAFLALQLVVWSGLWLGGLRPDGGPYPSVFYGLTVFHAAHVLVGLIALAALAWRSAWGAASRLVVELWGSYWRFVGLVWLAMYGALYLA